MKKTILFSLFLLVSTSVFAQQPKLKITLYPNNEFEYQCAFKLATDVDFTNEYCVEIIRKKLDEGFPADRQVVKVDFNCCQTNMLVGVCWGTAIPTKKELMMMSRNALAIANDPKVLGYTKVLY